MGSEDENWLMYFACGVDIILMRPILCQNHDFCNFDFWIQFCKSFMAKSLLCYMLSSVVIMLFYQMKDADCSATIAVIAKGLYGLCISAHKLSQARQSDKSVTISTRPVSIAACISKLVRAPQISTGENCLGMFECFDFLITDNLANLEIT